LQALLDENSARTFEKLAEALSVDKSTNFDRLHEKDYKKKANGFHMNHLN